MNVTQFVCQDIISYCDINTKYIVKRVCKQFANIKIILEQPEYNATKKWLLKYLLAIKITKRQDFKDKNIIRDGLDYACLKNDTKIVESISKMIAETYDINILHLYTFKTPNNYTSTRCLFWSFRFTLVPNRINMNFMNGI
jgi:hypothetical protein